jgi:hypothetical protein
MIDSPFYLIQVRSILSTGSLVYGDPPLTFYLLSLFSVLLGDVTLGVKVGVAFFSALSTIPAYFLMKKVGKSVLAGLIAMLLIIFSPSYITMLSNFMKNAVGICWRKQLVSGSNRPHFLSTQTPRTLIRMRLLTQGSIMGRRRRANSVKFPCDSTLEP